MSNNSLRRDLRPPAALTILISVSASFPSKSVEYGRVKKVLRSFPNSVTCFVFRYIASSFLNAFLVRRTHEKQMGLYAKGICNTMYVRERNILLAALDL